MTLAKDVAEWPTPQANERASRGNRRTNNSRRNRGGQSELADEVQCWPSPNSRDHKGSLPIGTRDRLMGTLDEAAEQIFSRPVQVISTDGIELSPTDRTTIERRRLNPAFVCWLMGWPWWWTRAEPISFVAAEMELWRQRQLSHLQFLLDALEL